MNFKQKLCLLVCLLMILIPDRSQRVRANEEEVHSQFTQEYTLPGAPLNLVVEAPNHLWFTMPDDNMIGSLIISQTVAFTPYTIPTTNSQPYDLLYHNGVIWFTERTGNKIGQLEIKTGAFQEYIIPTANSEPTGITLAPDGSLWFTERAGNKIGRFDPASATFVEYVYPTPNATLEDIAVSSSDLVWATSPALNRMISYDRSRSGFFDVFTGDQTRPLNVTVDSTAVPWITTSLANRIGRFTPGTISVWRWYDLPLNNSGVAGIFFKDNKDTFEFWYTGNTSGEVGQLTTHPSGKPLHLREQILTQPNSRPWGIAIDTDGQVWIAATGINKIIEWRPPYFMFLHIPVILKN